MERTCSFEVEVDEMSVLQFAELSGDRNPLHVERAYASTTEFGRPVAHGALLLAFVSRVLGMHVPGRRCLILSLKARFPKPVFYPERLRVEGRLRDFDPDRALGTVQVTLTAVDRSAVVVEAEVAFTLHTAPGDEPLERVAPASPLSGLEPGATPGSVRLLVTGGTGGLGEGVLETLSESFEMVCLTRRVTPASANRLFVQADLEDEDSLDDALAGLDPAGFYGVVHMSVPPVRQGRVSDDVHDMRRQLRHAVEVPLLLARWAARSGSNVRRVILLGSTAGSKFPNPRAGAYTVAKASMDVLAPLLAHDLAAQGATVNVVRPGFLPVGINRGVLSRAVKSQAARVPAGTLPEPADVAKLVAFLLSPGADHVNGATLTVDGGMLPQ